MAKLNILTLGSSKSYTDLVALGLSDVKVDNKNGKVTFTLNDGSTATYTFPTPTNGKDGISVTGILDKNDGTFTFTFSDGSESDPIILPKGIKGDKGDKGDKLTFSDLTDADKESLKGKPGKDAYSPTISVTDITGGHKVTVTDENGSKSFNVMNGEAFTYDNFTAEQLENLKGADGVSPTVTITEATGRHTVSFTDKDGVKSFVVKDGADLDVENYYTKDEVDTALTGKANADAIPTVPVNVSELNNDENYIKNTVDNLVHYYNKADTYTKIEVNSLISNIQKLTSQIVDELPTENIDTSVIYLIKIGDTSAYMQNMYINGAWAELGSTQVDLSDYYKKSEVDTKLADKADKTEIPTVPTLISAFTNDKGYMTEFTETDPTVPAWAKSPTKPQYTCEEIGALPDDTEIPIFTNKTVLDGVTAEKVADWDEAVTNKHSHTNKAVIDKFTESDDGTVLYNGEQIASGNLWHGTKAEYDALAEKDVDTTYIVTDEEYTIADALIDDNATNTQSTWSSEKIDNEKIGTDGVYRALELQAIDTGDIKNFLTFNTKIGTYVVRPAVTGMPIDNSYWMLTIDKIFHDNSTCRVVATRMSTNSSMYYMMYNSADKNYYKGWTKIAVTNIADVSNTQISFNTQYFTSDTKAYYCVRNGICYINFMTGNFSSSITEALTAKTVASGLPKPNASQMCHTFIPWAGQTNNQQVIFFVNGNGELIVHTTANIANACVYTSFSYPVAES